MYPRNYQKWKVQAFLETRRDMEEDARNGVRTVAQMLGPRLSVGFYVAPAARPKVAAFGAARLSSISPQLRER